MKKSIPVLIIFAVTFGLILSCISDNKSDIKPLIGKWKIVNVDTINRVLELNADNSWNYFKNDSLEEKGIFEISDDKFIMKHAKEENHSHKKGEKQEQPKDHEYKYLLNADKTELSIISDTKTIVFKKL